MPTHDNAFSANTGHTPTDATRTPAIAGPMAREMLMPTLFRAMADGSSSALTSSGTIAAHAGIVIAVPTPTAKGNASTPQGGVMSTAVSSGSAPAAVRNSTWAA